MRSAIEPNVIAGSPAWIICDRPNGIPTSRLISAAISSPRAASATDTARRSWDRSPTGVCDQASNAS